MYICVYPHLAFSKYQLSSSQFWLIAFKAFWWVLGRPPFLSSLTPITRLKSPAKIISSHAKSCKWSKTYFKKVGVNFCKGEQFFVSFNITKATLFLLSNTFSTFCFLNSIPICGFHHPCVGKYIAWKIYCDLSQQIQFLP